MSHLPPTKMTTRPITSLPPQEDGGTPIQGPQPREMHPPTTAASSSSILSTLRPHAGVGMGMFAPLPPPNLDPDRGCFSELRPDIEAYRSVLRDETAQLTADGKAMRDEYRALLDEITQMRVKASLPQPSCLASTWEGAPCTRPADRSINMQRDETHTRCFEHAHLRYDYGKEGFMGELKFWLTTSVSVERLLGEYVETDIKERGDAHPAEEFYVSNARASDDRAQIFPVGESRNSGGEGGSEPTGSAAVSGSEDYDEEKGRLEDRSA